MTDTVSARPHLVVGLLAAALAGILGVALWTWQGARRGQGSEDDRPLEGLKVLWPVPDFSLIERSGQRVTLADLRGKVWVANFIYTHCTDTCPLQTATIARLQGDLSGEPDVRLVSITVDPEQDTPEVLAEYAARFGANRDRWLFLTGEKKIIYALAQGGFRVGAVDPTDAAQAPPNTGSLSGRSRTSQRRPSQQPGAAWPEARRLAFHAIISFVEPLPAQAHAGHPGKPFMHSSLFVLVDRRARIRGYYHSDDGEALGRLRRDVRALVRESVIPAEAGIQKARLDSPVSNTGQALSSTE